MSLYCPHCGLEILDSNPKFCPRCGKEIVTQLPSNQPKESPQLPTLEPNPTPTSAQPLEDALPKPEPESAAPTPTASTQERVGAGWYVLAAALALLGGVVGYLSIKDKNLKVAKRLLYVGAGFTVVYLVAFASVDASILGTAPASVTAQQSTGKLGVNPDGGTGLYIAHIRFVSGGIDIVIENYAASSDEIGRIAIANSTSSQTLNESTAVYAIYGWPCNPSGPCTAASSMFEFQLAAYIDANNTKDILNASASYSNLSVAPYPTTITVFIPCQYFTGYKYYVIVQDPNDVTQDLAWNAPS